MNTGFDNLVNTLKDNGYRVVDSPQEIMRDKEVYVDVMSISKKDEFTGGYTFDVYVGVAIDRVDRSSALSELEEIIKIVDEAGCVLDSIESDILGEAIRFVVMTICREVVYVG